MIDKSTLPALRDVLRTPEERFTALPDFPYTPHYTLIGGLRIAHIDAGPQAAPPILLLHGEPSWSFLYRHVIPGLVAAGHRVIAPDLVGCGRSDKPSHPADYSYRRHVRWMTAWLLHHDLHEVTLFCQDWGSLIGLRMAMDHPERFARLVLANGGLPTGEGAVPRPFKVWQAFARWSPWFPVGRIVATGCVRPLSAAERAAYDAPFPNARFKAAVRSFPSFVPTSLRDPEHERNQTAWRCLEAWQKPFLTLFSSRDPITRGLESAFQQRVPGARGQPHDILRQAGHFLQEDCGPELARRIDAFVRRTPSAATAAVAPDPNGSSAP
jgi:haloalkane dehalogenase